MGIIFTIPSSCYNVPGIDQDQLWERRKGKGEYLYEVFSLERWLSQGVIAEDTGILSSLNLPRVHLAIMYLASLIHEGQALRVAGAKRARHKEHV